jgi:hypothetical protein
MGGAMGKKDILALIRKMPANVSAMEVIDELYFRLQVEKGLKDVAAGRVLSDSRLKARIARWRRSAGR